MHLKKTSIVLIGSGGVGTIAAFVLEAGGKACVTSFVRSDDEFVTARGYEVHSCDYGHIENFRPTNVVASVEEA